MSPMYIKISYRTETDPNGLARQLLVDPNRFGFDLPDNALGFLYSHTTLKGFIEKEERHEQRVLMPESEQSLASMSSGEQKKALLHYLMDQAPDYLVLVNPFENLDAASQKALKELLKHTLSHCSLFHLSTRSNEFLDLQGAHYHYLDGQLKTHHDSQKVNDLPHFTRDIPRPLEPWHPKYDPLVEFKGVNVSFHDKQVLNGIDWCLRAGEFWQLKGPNGSGKSTLVQLITGDSHKGYGQNIRLFGKRKGSGESVWDIKEQLGYFTPAMIQRFNGYSYAEHMLISGLYDSVGLYLRPSDEAKRLAQAWLELLAIPNRPFKNLSIGQQRLLMTARAMIKHPPLLLLDEPTIGLDDRSVAFFVQLVNQYARQSNSCVLFVTHHEEPGLVPKQQLELVPTETGSIGKITYL